MATNTSNQPTNLNLSRAVASAMGIASGAFLEVVEAETQQRADALQVAAATAQFQNEATTALADASKQSDLETAQATLGSAWATLSYSIGQMAGELVSEVAPRLVKLNGQIDNVGKQLDNVNAWESRLTASPAATLKATSEESENPLPTTRPRSNAIVDDSTLENEEETTPAPTQSVATTRIFADDFAFDSIDPESFEDEISYAKSLQSSTNPTEKTQYDDLMKRIYRKQQALQGQQSSLSGQKDQLMNRVRTIANSLGQGGQAGLMMGIQAAAQTAQAQQDYLKTLAQYFQQLMQQMYGVLGGVADNMNSMVQTAVSNLGAVARIYAA